MASQYASPGLLRNCDKVDMANVMSGLVAMEAYIRLPIASRYSTLLMRSISISAEGELLQEYVIPGVIGVAWAFVSLRANLSSMDSM